MDLVNLQKLAKLIRYYIFLSSTTAGSGHPTSSLSAVELMTTLYFKHLKYDLDNPQNPQNDRVIFSKGHASPLFYALYAAAGKISEQDLLTYRTFNSVLEGHPTPRFPYTEVPTGSLGQGLSVGVGEALALQGERVKGQGERKNETIDKKTLPLTLPPLPYVYVLLGDGEMAEGSVWEAMQTASHYKLDNLIAILDVNALGQSDKTMLEHNLDIYGNRAASFGWQVIKVTDGHDIEMVDKAFEIVSGRSSLVTGQKTNDERRMTSSKPTMIIAKTNKGHGVSFLQGKSGWHGKPLPKEDFEKAIKELGEVEKELKGKIELPASSFKSENLTNKNEGIASSSLTHQNDASSISFTSYKKDEEVATRKAFGNAIALFGQTDLDLVVLDGDVKNSTYTEIFEKSFPARFYQLYIAEQNMIGVATGMAKRGKKPIVATFSSFLTRAHDQIRMAGYAGVNILIAGSHAGVSIGEDGPSQMGLEDLSLFRTIFNSVVLYPSDAIQTERLTKLGLSQIGVTYIRVSRPNKRMLYTESEQFEIGGSKTFPVLSSASCEEKVTVVAAGVTLYEALKAQEELLKENIGIRVIDAYSIKPIDQATLKKASQETQAIITVEDHFAQGGLGDAVLEALADSPNVPIYKLAVTKMPKSGKPQELMDFEEISSQAIIAKVRSILSS